MKIGLVGLGKMGRNLALNMHDNKFDVVVYNRNSEKTKEFIEKGIEGAFTYKELIDKLDDKRKIVWIMVPSGHAVDTVISQIKPFLRKGDLVIDGGNSKYTDTIKRGKMLKTDGIHYMDVGTSGGTNGARNGACMMIGGEKSDYEELKTMFEAVCVTDGQMYLGKNGSGHFVKMIHNGVEYGMMQAIAEGFEILEASDFELDNYDVSKVWSNGSIIESYLMSTANKAFSKNKKLEGIVDEIDSSGEGLWTVEEALKLKLPSYVITASLMKRFESKQNERFSNKVVAALRNEFGGHKIYKK
ncbi:phosphogluconate dehydrogenase (NAD(+)-dependent, decarboxylating) [Helicovermis profundi]|uniref:Decarboxylating 6-phosphogluconate dehydrogenase n=1 Tax=Helicovermis profundi TaxID=3065157 RepID=A0AAU9E165_9FIRM|nr:decarboxylating 6-phosphogluconate dehydrogenase [Clostridia bacterium S502]